MDGPLSQSDGGGGDSNGGGLGQRLEEVVGGRDDLGELVPLEGLPGLAEGAELPRGVDEDLDVAPQVQRDGLKRDLVEQVEGSATDGVEEGEAGGRLRGGEGGEALQLRHEGGQAGELGVEVGLVGGRGGDGGGEGHGGGGGRGVQGDGGGGRGVQGDGSGGRG